jgi:hypothetical protein
MLPAVHTCPAGFMTTAVQQAGADVVAVTAVITSGATAVVDITYGALNKQTSTVEFTSVVWQKPVVVLVDAGALAEVTSLICTSSCTAPADCTSPVLPTSNTGADSSFGVGGSYTIECTASSNAGRSITKTFTLAVQLGESGSWSGGGGVNGKRGVGLSCACSADQSGAGGLAAGQVLACASRLTRPLLAGIAATECAALNGQPVSECTSWGHMSLRARMH